MSVDDSDSFDETIKSIETIEAIESIEPLKLSKIIEIIENNRISSKFIENSGSWLILWPLDGAKHAHLPHATL